MKTNYFVRSLAAIMIAGGMAGTGIATAQDPEAEQGMEVLTRGPVHEGFAETVVFDPTPGIIIDREPPELIEEVLPDQRPEGDNVAWIPGYWGWDEDQNDFIWISGIWRNLPPGRQWIPGYWAPLDGNYQWTSGYWQDEETTEVTYLPEPPKSLEVGPNIEASSSEQSWVPGSWQYQQDNYAWRAGYWTESRPNWIWIPSYYRWTPRGYVYVPGYWDHPVTNRGVVFAPVRFQRSYISRPGFSYSPLTVIALTVFTNHLFVRPSYGHYYFGDYYEPRYRNHYHASYSYAYGRHGCDPIFAHYRYVNRNDRNWVRERQTYFEYRRDHSDARPPRTWAALNSRPAQDRQRGDFGVAERYDLMVKNDGGGRQRFQAVNAKERERFVSQKQDIRRFSRERQQQELTAVKTRDGKAGKGEPDRVKMTKSPVLASKSGRSEKDGGPPAQLSENARTKGDGTKKPDKDAKGSKTDNKAPDDAEDKPKKADPTKPGKNNEPAEETRTKPGQRRDDAPNSKNNTKKDSNKDSEGKSSQDKEDKMPDKKTGEKPNNKDKPKTSENSDDKTSPKRQPEPTPKPKAEPAPKPKAEPAPQPKVQPAPKPKAEPAPKPKAEPAPKPKAEPTPESKGNSSPGADETDDKKSSGGKKKKDK